MRYLITRTSVWRSETPPCPGAVPHRYEDRTVYSYKSLAEARKDKRNAGREYVQFHGAVCSPPRIVDGWSISLESLDDVAELQRAEGPLIFRFDFSTQMPTIEIYDDYRE